MEEEIRSLKKTMLERVLSSETDSPNVITLPRVSNETVSALPNVRLFCNGLGKDSVEVEMLRISLLLFVSD